MSYTELVAAHDFQDLIDFVNENFRAVAFVNSVAKSSTFTQWAGDTVGSPEHYYSCSGTFSVSLVAASTADAAAGRVTVFKNAGVGTITLTADGSDTIEGAASIAVLASDSVNIVVSATTATNWEVF